MLVAAIIHTMIFNNHFVTQNGSKQNGTVYEEEMLGINGNRLYLCSAFETQVQDIEYLTNKNTRDYAERTERSRDPAESD